MATVVVRLRDSTVHISVPHQTGVRNGQIVRVQVKVEGEGEKLTLVGEVKEVVGSPPAITDHQRIAAGQGIYPEYSRKAMKQAEELLASKLITARDRSARTDFTHLDFVTIDNKTTVDIDDAVTVQRKPGGKGYILWVAMPDIAHAVPNDSALGKEAYHRGTSVYFPGNVFTMFPPEVEQRVFSLNEGAERLAMVYRLDISETGAVNGMEVSEGIVRSRKRLTYEQVQELWVAHQQAPTSDPRWAPQFELYALLKKNRMAALSDRIGINSPEFWFELDDMGRPTDMDTRPHFEAHELIEEFMVATNAASGKWLAERHLPGVFRTHGEPIAAKAPRLFDMARAMGLDVTLTLDKPIMPQVRDLMTLARTQGKDRPLMSEYTRTMMPRAEYRSSPLPHYALGLQQYAQVTSPIRRLGDLENQRMMKWALHHDLGTTDEAVQLRWAAECTEAADRALMRSHLAYKSELATVSLKRMRLFLSEKRVGQVYEGEVVHISDRFVIVWVESLQMDVLLHMEPLFSAGYELNADAFTLTSVHGHVYRLGEPARIQLTGIDLVRGQMSFEFSDP